MFLLIVVALFGLVSTFPSGSLPESTFSGLDGPLPSSSDNSNIFFDSNGKFVNMDVDGVTVESLHVQKKREKLPMMKKQEKKYFEDFSKFVEFDKASEEGFDDSTTQPGVVPHLPEAAKVEETTTPVNFDYFNFGEEPSAVANPAATFLEGGNFDKIATPKCRMSGCVGPVVNDGSILTDQTQKDGASCHQTFVPMNTCTDNKGYPMGMLCTICCDCTEEFITEMKKTSGYLITGVDV
ncbi:unnamed protein product [Auanema sp. JU1783]|nr:unnamed protein product [Auanema sp. JU1783]